jgi:hypothetical protein
MAKFRFSSNIFGRLEVGLGAGHMKWEFDAAGLP